ncbi:TPA_asm: L [Morus betacytorhabdovirus 1]|nr:TPA_asm: L [Morus betacytorhabdovirus 1]
MDPEMDIRDFFRSADFYEKDGGFLDDLLLKRENTPGLGDFHLRSAIKAVQLAKLKAGKGRKREKADFEAFSYEFYDNKIGIENGDATQLLAYFLTFREALVEFFKGSDLIRQAEDDADISSSVIKRRIRLEMIRDKGMKSLSKEGDIRTKILESLGNVSRNTYSDLRAITENIIIGMNSVASKRKFPEHLRPSILESKNEDGLTKIFTLMIGNLMMCFGGDLIFYRPMVEDVWFTMTKDQEILLDQLLKSNTDAMSECPVWMNGNDYWGVTSKSNPWRCVSADVMRMINDKITERDILMRTSDWFNPVLDHIYPDKRVIENVFFIGDVALSAFKNHAYKLIKVFESLIIGILLSRCNSIIVNKTEFLESTINDLVESNPEFYNFLIVWRMYIESLSSDHHISQIYGLYRLWGHPEINSQEGLKKVMRIGTMKKEIVPELAHQAGYHFMEEVYSRYRKKWGRYPPFKIARETSVSEEEIEGDYLIQCLTGNTELDIKCDKYLMSSWRFIDTQKTFDIPATFNLTMVVDDKAISPPKSHLIAVAKKEKSLMDPYERRGVLKFMRNPYIECESFLKEINDNSLDDDDCVIGLYPKERELNSVPRMFSLMSAKMRNYVVVTEHMIADDILPYFPQITMTNDLLSLTKKIYSTTRRQETNSAASYNTKSGISTYDLSVCINMDFEKWNLNMRKESTHHVFYQMGKLYGLPDLFNRTYDIFEQSFIYVSDENFRLQIKPCGESGHKLKEDGESSYTGHVGGFEGLRQKGWTVFTVVVIKMILERYPVSYKLMGQGDNQVLLVTMTTSCVDDGGHITQDGINQLKILLNDIMMSLETIFKGMGLPLKTLESWKSEEFFLYGKFPVKNGVPLSMSMKKLCRTFPFSNDDTMTIDNMMGSVFTNAQSAAMSDIFHLPSYYSGLYEMLSGIQILLRYHPMTGKSFLDSLQDTAGWFTYENVVLGDSSRSKKIFKPLVMPLSVSEFSEMLSMIPKSLGGSNGMTEYEFLMRGFPDNQTRDFTYLSEILMSCAESPDLTSDVEKETCSRIMAVCRLNFSISQNYDFLVEDPCALNLLQPETPLTLLRKKVKSTLSKNVTFENTSFMELFKLTSDERKRELLLKLAEGDKLFPRILHDCYASTLFGFVDGIVSKVDKTVTVQRMCLERSSEDIVKAIMRVEENFIKYLYWRSTSYRTSDYAEEPDLTCPTLYIKWARDFSWKKEVQGVGVPYPSHILRYKGEADILHCDHTDRISCHISDYTPKDLIGLTNKLGRAPPYLGSMTKEKVKSYDRVALYSSEPLLKRVIHLMKAVSWGNLRNSNLKNFLDNVLDSVSDLDKDMFLLKDDDIGGSIEHRYRDLALKHGALASFMYGIGTWLHLSTDDFSKYSKGSKNVTLHFQAILCWAQAQMYEILLNRCSEGNKSCVKEFHFHISCERCILPVQYNVPDIPPIPKQLIPSLRQNPYCFTKNVILTSRDRSAFSASSLFSINLNATVADLKKNESKFLFHEYWAYEICKDIMGDTDIDEGAVGVGVLELNKYPRIAFLRASVRDLLNAILDKLFVQELTHIAKMDSYNELSLTVRSAYTSVRNRILEASSYSFIGISILFSWPAKIYEILEVDPTVMPRTKALTMNEGLKAGRDLLLSYLERDYIPLNKSIRYINLTEGQSVFQSLKMRYIYCSGAVTDSFCRECRREILLNISEEEIGDLDGNSQCSKGHRWFEKDMLLKRFRVVCIPEDSLSKSLSSDLIIPKSMSYENEVFATCAGFLANCNEIPNMVAVRDADITFESFAMSAKESMFKYSKSAWHPSKMQKSLPFDMSSNYRLLEVLLGSSVKRSEGDFIVMLGDGMGGSSYLVESLTNKKIIASTLLDCTLAFPQTFPHCNPSGHYDSARSENIDYSMSKQVINDIWSDDFLSFLNKKLSKVTSVMFGICDIELEHEDSIKGKYSSLILRVYRLRRVKTWLLKIRVSNNVELYQAVENGLSCFEKINVLITPHCNCNKGELFLQLGERRESLMMRDNIVVSTKTRQMLNQTMHTYTEGRRHLHLSKAYYFGLSEILLSGKVLAKSISILQGWFNNFGIDFDIEQESFTQMYLSLFSKKNPMQAAHRTDKKESYEYLDTLNVIGSRILTLGLGMIKDEEVLAHHFRNFDQFCLLRPTKTGISKSGRFVKKYTYVVSHISKVDLVKKKFRGFDFNILPPLKITPIEGIRRFIPLVRLLFDRQGRNQNIKSLEAIMFKYCSRKKRMELFQRKKTDVYLPVSKTCDILIYGDE